MSRRPAYALAALAAGTLALASCRDQEAGEHSPRARRREAIEQLESLGYLGSTGERIEAAGVTRHHPEKTQPGLNLWVSGHAPVAILMDLEGNVLHRWSWSPPAGDAELYMRQERRHWRRAELLENGELLAIFEGRSLIKLDRHSNLLWAFRGNPHHDLEVLPGGDILVLTRKARMMPELHPEEPILEDHLSWLSPAGKLERRLSLVKCFLRSEFGRIWTAAGRTSGDLLHTNSVEVLDGRLAARVAAFRPGNVLISMRAPSALAVVDPEERKVVWLHRGRFRFQHDAEVVAGGSLLLFDNGNPAVGRSRILELDPRTMRTRWRYSGSAESPFYSQFRGSSQRLENGNTLIAESDRGRAFEVTRSGDIVWEYLNPHSVRDAPDTRASLAHMERLPERRVSGWLAQEPPAGGGVVERETLR